MFNQFGKNFRIEIFGESHGPEVGVKVDGLPAGTVIDLRQLGTFLDRRAPGKSEVESARKEDDVPVFTSGVKKAAGETTLEADGQTITAVIKNKDVRSRDYEAIAHTPRPGHADFPAMIKSGTMRVPEGGGPFSGRMTAPLCIAGGIALQELERRGIRVHAEAMKIAGETERDAMVEAIKAAKADGDSVGGIIRCWVENLPVGIGEPMFGGLENHIAQAVFGVPAIKGIDFGEGFGVAELRGSENNDEFFVGTTPDGKQTVRTKTNHAGGILGGMSNGMPLWFTVAVKPTPSIAKVQKTVDMEKMVETEISVGGRHDPCIVLRAVPCIEAAAAVAIYDLILESELEA